MLQANELRGRAVVDLDVAEKIGALAELVLDPASQRVAGLIIAQRHSIFGSGRQIVLPAAVVHAVGPDAITVRHLGEASLEMWQLSGLPRLSQITGRKVVSYSGKLLGRVDDVLIDPADGRIVGYALGSGRPGRALERWLAGETKRPPPDYVRADVDLRVGPSIIMVPDDAVIRGDEAAAETAADAGDRVPAAPSAGWSDYALDMEPRESWDAAPSGAAELVYGGAERQAAPALERTAPMRPMAYRDGFARDDGRIA